ncbi:ABC transporter permease [Bordetella genomosp. 6]|uniref:ABC transporter permease n=1 Tax=Bordetella genomosp. 6 TaxID=463024 RepID=UPI000A2912E0|nr:ABC transporter permease [Bordetella genomosp. 6]ARP78484.1 ABC transporter permease [Bordetella genomosp. 6]
MGNRFSNVLLPLVTLVLILGFWDISVRWLGMPAYLLPPPLDVFRALWHGYSTGLLWPHLLTTTAETIGGFVLGCSVALVVGGLVAEFRLLERMVYPYVVALQSMPKVALAPLLIVWFGFGLMSKVVLVALICFFPMFVNVVTGLRSARQELIDLYTAFSASRFQIFRDIKLPSALPSIFAGLQIALVLSLLGAVVGEFVASQKGLGSLIQAASLNFDLPIMFACILTLAFMGAMATLVVNWAQRRLLFWHETTAGQDRKAR